MTRIEFFHRALLVYAHEENVAEKADALLKIATEWSDFLVEDDHNIVQIAFQKEEDGGDWRLYAVTANGNVYKFCEETDNWTEGWLLVEGVDLRPMEKKKLGSNP
jgi:hypothetical protein